jgi:threonine dehydrogenase-like Zn-dependent dehydrogenase
MKAIVWLGPRRMEAQEVDTPSPAPREALLRVAAVGICGSELSGYLGQNSLRVPPLIMGHEFAGEVVACGEQVEGLRVGDAVLVNPLSGCGACQFCRQGLENLCPQRQLVGVHRPGAFAELVAVPAANCFRLPAGVTPTGGSLAEPLACGVRAARLAGVAAGSRVLVLGAGPIGLMCMAAARRVGGEVVLAADVNAGRLATAARWGAGATCNARERNPAELARQSTGGLGVDVAIDAVGSDSTRRAAIEAVRPGGTVVFIGLHEAESPIQANHLVRSEIRVVGSFAYTQADFAEAVAMLADGAVRPAPDWLAERPLDACADSFAELIDAPPDIAKIVLRP